MADEERLGLDGQAENNTPPVYRSLMDCALPSIDDARPSIIRPTIAANHFEIKPAIIQMVQNTVQFGFITTWDDLANAFLTKFFPPSKSMKLRADITIFAQGEQEILYEAWERYKDLLRRCPHHQLPDGLVSERSAARRSAGIHQVDAFTSVAAQLEVMNKRIEELSLGHSAMHIQEVWCEKCGAEHFTKDCQTGNPSHQPEEGMEENSSMEQMMQKFISSTEIRMQNQDASIKKLKNQIGQLAKAMSSRDPGTFPSDTEKNPKEQVKTVELRSGKRIEYERQEAKEPEDTVPEKTAEVFKKLNINIPFADALMQMPSYAKFLKEILSNKRKLEENARISLTGNFSALVQQDPTKAKRSREFLYPLHD
ncbi:uncharacterized protein [Henckelia pumila]|uniref:uncharacterized protein n=1 Tax=Henckelia pumila TaxID=405737 RepID=UPI003C6E2D44